jgi:hypothetical protein
VESHVDEEPLEIIDLAAPIVDIITDASFPTEGVDSLTIPELQPNRWRKSCAESLTRLGSVRSGTSPNNF